MACDGLTFLENKWPIIKNNTEQVSKRLLWENVTFESGRHMDNTICDEDADILCLTWFETVVIVS